MKISEWINDGHLKSKMILIENEVVKESDKAVCLKCQKVNAYGDLQNSSCWFPKSQVKVAENDYYDNFNGGFFVPSWLIEKKKLEGFEI